MKAEDKKILRTLGEVASKKNIKAWAVGGVARDNILHKTTRDIDLCIEGETKPLLDFCSSKYNAKIQKFNNFGTARVFLNNGLKLDFVRCRKEVYPRPAALPIVSPSVLEDDLKRRDFTCNAIALSLLPNEFFKIYDLFDGLCALKKKEISILHSKSFIDDPTRIFRALRFAARFNFKLSKQTVECLKDAINKKVINLLTPARKTNELIKILEEDKPTKVFKLLKKYHIDNFIFPCLKVPSSLDDFKTLQARLALLILAQGGQALSFLKTLETNKNNLKLTYVLLDFYDKKMSPLTSFSKMECALIKVLTPKISKSAFKKCIISGQNLQEFGLKGPAIKEALTRMRLAQFKGSIRTIKEAKNFLKHHYLPIK